MARPVGETRTPRALTLASAAVIIAGLYFGREVLIPIALAVLLSFLLAPLVSRVQRFGVPKTASIILTVLLAFCVLGGIGALVGGQVRDVSDNIPKYRDNIGKRVEWVQGLWERYKNVQKELAPASTAPASQPAVGGTAGVSGTGRDKAGVEKVDEDHPMAVKVIEPAPSAWEVIANLGLVLSPLGYALIVSILVIFTLAGREDLRDRLIRLIGPGQINMTTQALDDAAGRVSKYLLMQTAVNGMLGLAVGTGMAVVGIPNAILWGLLAALLRFIPYVGVWAAFTMPFLISLAYFPDWGHAIEVTGIFVVCELVTGNFLEPKIYGSSTGTSELAILVAAIFWTWLWGPIGLLLSTPLTVCLVVMGKYVPQLEWLSILLGDAPVLSPAERVYQRLLAGDQEEASDVVEEFLKGKTLVEVYDTVLMGALAMAAGERRRGGITDDRWKFMNDAMTELIDDLAEADEKKVEKEVVRVEKATGVEANATATYDLMVLILPAFDEPDALGGRMLGNLLKREGYPSRALSVNSLASEMVAAVAEHEASITCISALPPSAIAHSRYLCKRLRASHEEGQLIMGLWTHPMEEAKLRDRLRCGTGNDVVISLADAMSRVRQKGQARLNPREKVES